MKIIICSGVLASFILYNLFLFSDHHRIRVSLIKVKEIENSDLIYKPPEELEEFEFEERRIIKSFDFPLSPKLEGSNESIGKATEILNQIGIIYHRQKPSSHRVPESPEIIKYYLDEENIRGSCYNDSILFSTVVQQHGYHSRLLALTAGDGMGGSGHSVVEVWVKKLNKWIFFDPQQSAFLTDSSGNYVSAREIREILLSDNPEKKLKVHQGVGYLIAAEKLIDYYRPRFVDILYSTQNNLYLANKESFLRKISTFVESQSISRGQLFLKLGRFLRSLFTQQTRYRLVDNFNPKSYNPKLWFYTYRIWLFFFVISLIILSSLLTKTIFRCISTKIGRPKANHTD